MDENGRVTESTKGRPLRYKLGVTSPSDVHLERDPVTGGRNDSDEKDLHRDGTVRPQNREK